MTVAFFRSDDFDGQFRRTLAKTYLGAASIGEALALGGASRRGSRPAPRPPRPAGRPRRPEGSS